MTASKSPCVYVATGQRTRDVRILFTKASLMTAIMQERSPAGRHRLTSHISPLPKDKVVHVQTGALLPDRDIDEHASGLDGPEGRINSDLRTRTVEANVRPQTVSQLLHLCHDVGDRGVDDMVSTKRGGKFASALGNLGDDDVLAPPADQGLYDRQADRPSTEDEGGIAFTVGADADRMPAD